MDDIPIPPEARDALEKYFYDTFKITYSHGAINGAIRAVLAAWPGMREAEYDDNGFRAFKSHRIILPLSQEDA